jgi:hypothetical protein
VPRPKNTRGVDLHKDKNWLNTRIELLKNTLIPSVQHFKHPLVLLCSTESISYVSQQLSAFSWIETLEENDWYGSHHFSKDHTITRIDSDDAIHKNWFQRIDKAPKHYDRLYVSQHLMYDMPNKKLFLVRRKYPLPLAAFRFGQNPYQVDHGQLAQNGSAKLMEGCFLLQTVHEHNLLNKIPPSAEEVPIRLLEPFGIKP